PMFHVLGFQDEDGAFVGPDQISKDFSLLKEQTRGFRLVEGKRYRLRVMEWCEPPLGVATIAAAAAAQFRSDVLHLEGASNLVVGRYDTLEFTLLGNKPGYTELAITVSPLKQREQDRGSAPVDKTGDGAISDSTHDSTPSARSPEWPSIFA